MANSSFPGKKLPTPEAKATESPPKKRSGACDAAHRRRQDLAFWAKPLSIEPFLQRFQANQVLWPPLEGSLEHLSGKLSAATKSPCASLSRSALRCPEQEGMVVKETKTHKGLIALELEKRQHGRSRRTWALSLTRPGWLKRLERLIQSSGP